MIVKRKAICTKCGSEQMLESTEYKECPNGCYRIKYGYFGYEYDTNNGMTNCIEFEGKTIEIMEDKDLVIDYKEIEHIVDEIEKLNEGMEAWQRGYITIRKYKRTYENAEVFDHLYFEFYEVINDFLETNRIECDLKLVRSNGKRLTEEELLEQKNEIKEKLSRFLEIAKKHRNKELDFTRTRSLQKELPEVEMEQESKEIYDYVFKI